MFSLNTNVFPFGVNQIRKMRLSFAYEFIQLAVKFITLFPLKGEFVSKVA